MQSNNNYQVRRRGTRYTQTLDKIPLKLYARIKNQKGPYQLSDPEVKPTHDDWYAQAWKTKVGEVLSGDATEIQPEEVTIT